MYAEFWLMAKGYMEKNHISVAAEHFVNFIMEYEDNTDVLKEMKGADTELDTAIELFLESHEIEELEEEN